MVLRGSYYDENGPLLREIEGADPTDYPRRFTTKRTKSTKNGADQGLTSLSLRNVQCLCSAVPGGAGTFRFVCFVCFVVNDPADEYGPRGDRKG
jgi:hypothetical protein